MEDNIDFQLEIAATATNPRGDITHERISRTDGITKSELVADFSNPAEIDTVRTRRVAGFEEEGDVAAALAAARNAKLGTRYVVAEKQREDSDYADRVLISTTDHPTKIDVQIRHFDTELIATLNRKKQFTGTRTCIDLARGISTAIVSKSQVDPATRSRAILLLQIPSTIGQIARKQLQRRGFDLMGFREVWVRSFREEPFQVFSPIPENSVAVAAYYLWEKAGRPFGDDQKFWFSAIDQCNGT